MVDKPAQVNKAPVESRRGRCRILEDVEFLLNRQASVSLLNFLTFLAKNNKTIHHWTLLQSREGDGANRIGRHHFIVRYVIPWDNNKR